MRTLALALAMVCGATLVSGQQPDTRYEIRSFKRNTSSDPRNVSSYSPDRLVHTNLSLVTLIARAYFTTPRSEWENLPPWVRTDRYDVEIAGPFNDPPAQQRAALRSLLAERLKLIAHTIIRTEPGYDLVPVRADGQPGPALKAPQCSARADAGPPRSHSNYLTAEDAMSRCGWWAPGGTGVLYSGGMSMAMIANFLEGHVGRKVVDRTNMKAAYAVKWAYAEPGVHPPDIGDLMFRLERDLGLRLLPSTTDVEVVVIDHIERPSER